MSGGEEVRGREHKVALEMGALCESNGLHDLEKPGAGSGSRRRLSDDCRVRIRTILRFLPVTRYFFGKNFSRADLAGAQEWIMHEAK